MIPRRKHISDSCLSISGGLLRCCAGYLLLDLRLAKLGKISGFLISVILMDSVAPSEACRAVVCYTHFENFLWHGFLMLFICLAVLTSVT